jgi:hypothetical protein
VAARDAFLQMLYVMTSFRRVDLYCRCFARLEWIVSPNVAAHSPQSVVRAMTDDLGKLVTARCCFAVAMMCSPR